MRIGALEAGGTKMVCGVGNEFGQIECLEKFPTRTPETTMPQMISFFKEHKIEALGIGCFGPIDLHKESTTYGCITSSPKEAWRNYNILKEFSKELACPIGLDTDVNAACLGEMEYGAAKNCKNVIYITIGTGVGMGICAEGTLLHGVMHPEAGHMFVKRLPSDSFEGTCPFHKDCLEGLVSGGAIGARYGKKAYEIPVQDVAWTYTAHYIAEAIANLILTLEPERIILGGGVMEQEQLLFLIQKEVISLLHGYLGIKQLHKIEDYIVRPGCKGDQGVLGALLLGRNELSK
ncbi:MAG: ROK family protein [bacterium]|nr:ROK family protein [bacterium]